MFGAISIRILAAACLPALVLTIACRPEIAASTLREDPALAERLAAQPAATKRFDASRDMTPAEADALGARIAGNPGDWDARERLVTYYRAGRAVPWEKKVPGLRRHALWLIEHHPEHDVQAPLLSPEYDPEGLERALTIQPDLLPARVSLAKIRLWERHERFSEARERGAQVADTDRLAYEADQMPTGEPAVAHAEETLRLAAERRQDPAYSSAVLTAHFVLSEAATRQGDRENVLRHLHEAVTVPPSEEVAYSPAYGWMTPVNYLLKAGERERVVEFLEAYARLSVVQRDRLLRDARNIREGRMPAAYQHMVASETPRPRL